MMYYKGKLIDESKAVWLLDLRTGERFPKEIDSPFLREKFIKKCKYSDKLKVISYPNFVR